MASEPKKDDRVEWKTSQGKTTGTVERRITPPMKIKGGFGGEPRAARAKREDRRGGGAQARGSEESQKVAMTGEDSETVDDFSDRGHDPTS